MPNISLPLTESFSFICYLFVLTPLFSYVYVCVCVYDCRASFIGLDLRQTKI